MICALKPKAGGNKTIVKQEREISEADWIPVDDFLEHGSGKLFFITRLLLNIESRKLFRFHLKPRPKALLNLEIFESLKVY